MDCVDIYNFMLFLGKKQCIDLYVFLLLFFFLVLSYFVSLFNLNFIKQNRMKCVGVKGIASGSVYIWTSI